VFVGMEQPSNFREEGGLDRVSVDIVSEGLHVGAKVFVEIFQSAVVCDQDTDIHSVHDALGTETLEVLAYGRVGLSNLVWFRQDLFVEGEIGFKGEEDCRLINSAENMHILFSAGVKSGWSLLKKKLAIQISND